MADGSSKSSGRPTFAMAVYGEAVELVAQAYAESQGEETQECTMLERLRDMKRDEALEAFARYERHCDGMLAAIERERARLEVAEAQVKEARAWTCQQMLDLLEREGLTKADAGAFRITTRAGSRFVHCADIDLASLPPSLVRWSEPKPSEPALDKKAATKYLEDGSNPPIDGLSLQRKPRTLKVE